MAKEPGAVVNAVNAAKKCETLGTGCARYKVNHTNCGRLALVTLFSVSWSVAALNAQRVSVEFGPKKPQPITIFSSDGILPQVADGAHWQTSITLMNLTPAQTNYKLSFYDDNGNPLILPFAGSGSSTTFSGTLGPYASNVVQTEGTAPTLSQGWALLESDTTVAALGVYRSRVPSRPDFEAIVPASSEFDSHFMLAFDNTNGFSTGVAIVNPSTFADAPVTITFRDENGTPFATKQLTLGILKHVAFTLPQQYTETQNRRGTMEVITTGFQLSGMGLRFNPGGAFTSFHAVSDVGW